ncbi:MAG TPA: hypothetical protein PLX69_02760 [Leptospiraceae bacterium]|nr:hypothetical protein [Leptospiraceae bacterium]
MKTLPLLRTGWEAYPTCKMDTLKQWRTGIPACRYSEKAPFTPKYFFFIADRLGSLFYQLIDAINHKPIPVY